jgi:hypothetical protein
MRTSQKLMSGALVPLALVVLSGCVTLSWHDAREMDTVAAYHRFLRDHPESGYAEEARERLEYHRVKVHPTIPSFDGFEERYPNSEMLPELKAFVEPLYFERARDLNSPKAYDHFLRNYPNGQYTSRARGNLIYLTKIRAYPSPRQLEWFVATHAASDFVPLARRTLELIELQKKSGIKQLGVQVRVGPGVIGEERIRRGFAGVIHREYQKYDVEVSLLDERSGIPKGIDAWMQIEYNEVPAEGTFGRRTLISHCRVRMYHRDSDEPIWDRTFEAPAEHAASRGQREDPTVFGSKRYRFWEEFFVPVSTWATSRTRVFRQEFSDPVAAVDLVDDHAIILLKDGSLEYYDLSNPLDPTVIRRSRHARDLTEWTGVVLVPGDRVVAYGPNGAEVTDLSSGAQELARWEPLDVGSVVAGARSGPTVLLAGERGLFAVRAHRNPPMLYRLTEEPLVGVAISEPYVHLITERGLMVTNAADLVRWSEAGGGASAPAIRRLTFPAEFQARRTHPLDDLVFVLGRKDIVEVDLSDPLEPRLVRQVSSEAFGNINDVVAMGGRLYVVGDRGLEVADREGVWVADRIQVDANQRVRAMGRFLVLAGGPVVEVLDVSPYTAAASDTRKPKTAPAKPDEAPAKADRGER